MSKSKLVITARIEGLDELRKAFDELERNTRKETLAQAAQAGASVVQDEANRRAPGPHVETREGKSGATAALVEIGPDKEHWYYQFAETGAQPHEIGGNPLVFEGDIGLVITRRVNHPGRAADPFLRPALDSAGDNAKEAASEILKDAVLGACRG